MIPAEEPAAPTDSEFGSDASTLGGSDSYPEAEGDEAMPLLNQVPSTDTDGQFDLAEQPRTERGLLFAVIDPL